MKLEIIEEIEIGDGVAYVDDLDEIYLVCDISEIKYGLYNPNKYDGLMWYWKDECKLIKKAIYVEVVE